MERDCESELSKLNIEQNACIYHFGASVIHGQRSNILRLRFKGNVDFDKKIEGTREKYKQSILEGIDGNLDVPYYAFVIKSIEDYEMKLGYVLTDVFKNW